MWPLILAGAGLMGAKSLLVDRPREERQRKQRAAEIRYNPWTNIAPSTQIQESDALGSMMQGGMTGAMLGQNLQNQEMAKALGDQQIQYFKNLNAKGYTPSPMLGTNPYTMPSGSFNWLSN